MKYTVSIKRQKDKDSRPYIFTTYYDSDGNESIATMLENMNRNSQDKIGWQCSCMQKKCGACAMVINHVPGLACSTFLRDLGRKIRLEPLSKFPLVRDLIVNREPVFEQLRQRKMWTEEYDLSYTEFENQRFQAASCIMCGCCLEVCPEFSVQEKHLGAVGVTAAYRLITAEEDDDHKKELKEAYIGTVYNTCGTALSCMNICPLHLPLEELMVRNNTLD